MARRKRASVLSRPSEGNSKRLGVSEKPSFIEGVPEGNKVLTILQQLFHDKPKHYLTMMLRDSSPLVRFGALQALSLHELDNELLAALEDFKDESALEVREACANLLRNHLTHSSQPLVEASDLLKQLTFAIGRGAQSPRLPSQKASLPAVFPEDSSIGDLIWEGIECYSIPTILELLRSSNRILSLSAARVIHLRGVDRIAFEEIIALARDPVPARREACAITLGQIQKPTTPYRVESIEVLQELLDDLVMSVRVEAIAALGHLAMGELPPALEKRLLDFLNDSSEEVRSATALTLGRLWNSPSRKLLVQQLNELREDSSEDVKDSAEMAIELLDEMMTDV